MNKGLAWIVIILLALLLAVQGYELYSDLQAAQQRKTIADDMAFLMEQQQEAIGSVMVDYHASAYGESVDRIAEQQLIATEFQLQMLQILAAQNGKIMELLVNVE